RLHMWTEQPKIGLGQRALVEGRATLPLPLDRVARHLFGGQAARDRLPQAPQRTYALRVTLHEARHCGAAWPAVEGAHRTERPAVLQGVGRWGAVQQPLANLPMGDRLLKDGTLRLGEVSGAPRPDQHVA